MSIGTEFPRISVDQIVPLAAGGSVQFGDGPNPTGFGADGNALLPVNVELLAAKKTLLTTDAIFQKIDPGGDQDVILPPEASGLCFYIFNNCTGAAGEDITVKEDAEAVTIATLEEAEFAWFVCDGTTWHHLGITPSAAS